MRSRDRHRIVKIRAGALRVIPDENRSIRPPWRRWLAAHWDKNKVGVLAANDRQDGEYPFVMVGQHRTLAALDRFGPDYVFDVELFIGLTPDEEAEVWLGRDVETRGASTIDKYHQKLRAMRDPALQIEKSLANRGLKVGRSTSPTTIACVGLLNTLQGKGVLDVTLDVAMAAWPSYLGAEVWNHHILGGVGYFLAEYPNADLPSLSKKLERIHPSVLVTTGSALMGTSTVKAVGVQRAIKAAYNKGRRSGAL